MKEHLDKVKFAASKALTRLVIKALDDARLQIEAQTMRFAGAKPPSIAEESGGIAERFMNSIHSYFEELTTLVVKDPEIEPDSYDNLSLVDHDYLEAMIAMEGMVKQLRDKEIKGMRSFITRLETMYPNICIVETNNPLDPEQVGDCFNEAIKPLGFKAHYLLTIYREFNKTVFGKYDDVIAEANYLLVDLGVLPDLEIAVRERELRKQKRDEARAQMEKELQLKAAEEQAKLEARMTRKPASLDQAQAEKFSTMQTLVHGLANQSNNAGLGATAGAEISGELVAEHEEIRKQRQTLVGMLTDIQSNMLNKAARSETSGSISANYATQFINDSLKAKQSSGNLGAISAQSGDVINLVTMLYEAIWKDEALPVVMKELIGRTQITIMKVALTDTTFFNNQNHPARALLNELALAGISWTQTANLESDPVYHTVKQIVEQLLTESAPSDKFLQQLLNDLRVSRSKIVGTDLNLERRVRESENIGRSMDDVNEYVRQKIHERVLKGSLDPSIRNLLDTHIHSFLVKLLTREGPEGKSWKPVMSTIDVLLWTVQAEKHVGDRERFERINPRLLDNLGKALEIGGASKTKITKIMRQLKQVQEFTFHQAKHLATAEPSKNGNSLNSRVILATRNKKDVPTLPRNDPDLRRVDKFAIGTWMEFRGTSGERVRCALASKIDSIEKLFFANSEGKKVIELTRMRLAHELKAGAVKVVSEGSLMNRAMESVITNLKRTSAQKPRRQASA